MRLTLLLAGLTAFCAQAFAQTQPAEVTSPNGELKLTVRTGDKDGKPTPDGRLVYEVTFRGQRLIDASGLRLDLQGQRPLGEAVRVTGSTVSQADTTYKLVTGKVSTVRDRHNAMRVEVEETVGLKRRLVIEARAFDDAVAFRYVLPGQPLMRDFRLLKEGTEFRIAKDAVSYALLLPNYRSMYEGEFVKFPLSAMSNQGGVASTMLVGLPLLMELPGVAWMAITEADVRNVPAMYVVNPSGSWLGHWLESRLAPSLADSEVCAYGTVPFEFAWRVMMVAADPGRLIESTVLTSLNPPQAIKDTSWIRAGKSAWNWWNGSIGPDGKAAFTTATMKYLTDFAASSGLEYVLVDAGWSPFNDITKVSGRVDVPELVEYAKSKGVGVWIWLHYSPTDRQMDEAFPLYEKWGVAGLKIDFVSRDDQIGMRFYHRVAEKAAQHRLMVDFHGSTKPSGIERTWPNVLGYEAVLGMEQSKAGARDNPESHVMLPFTRMLAGPMDYTPGGFDNVTREEFAPRERRPQVMGTRAHHLAMYVVYEAPFQMVADHPQAYEGQPAFEFIRKVPANWDETRVIGGVPGEWITIARRRGDEWYIGSMTNQTARDLAIPLEFMAEGRYTAEIYSDAADADRFPKNIEVAKRPVLRGETLKVRLAKDGGLAVRLTPLK
jgi:alpha-glucosidase